MHTDSFIIRIKTKDFYIKILQLILKNGLTHHTLAKMIIDHFQEV